MRNIINILVFLSLITLPIDSFPYIFPSVYRPLSLFFIALAFPFVALDNLKKGIIRKRNVYILIFYIITITNSFIISYFKYSKFDGFTDYTVTLSIGLFSYLVFDNYFYSKRKEFKENKVYIDWIFKFIGKVYKVVLFIGLIEVFVMIGIIPFEAKKIFADLIAGRVTQRIQLTSGEPSWASMHLIFSLPVFGYLKSIDYKYKKYYILSIILLLLTFSMQGYLIFFIGLVVFIISENKLTVTLKYIAITTLLLLGVSISYSILNKFLFSDVYYITRITKLFSISNIKDIFYLDGSVFVRLIYPTIALIIFKDNIILGVGGGNFRYVLEEYVLNYFPKGLQFTEVSSALDATLGNPMNMYTRLLSETGLFCSLLFFLFIKNLYSKVKKLEIKNNRYLKLWIIFMLSIYLQFDSLAYLNIWLVFAVINNIEYDISKGCEV